MVAAGTIYGLIDDAAARLPEASALEAPGRLPLSYAGLSVLVRRTADALARFGLDRNDRVGVVLPNGPEMAAAFLGITARATIAPLNPAYRPEEFDFYLADLEARALVVQAGSDSPSRAVARTRGIPVIELVPDGSAPAGTFCLAGATVATDVPAQLAGPGNVALMLHTSGTTSRPKLVPLTQTNLCASAGHVRAALELTRGDRCLNVMPLFHIHGLVAAVLGSIAGGGSVICTPGFYATHFFEWMDQCHPSWYTAVPTMHQSILARARQNRDVIERRRLRFIRSSSAALSRPVMSELEQTFGVPVIEAYGMTEAAHQMACNPLPPASRKPGSVGIAAGPEIAIMDETGALLPAGHLGEVVIRGPNVTRGYENNAAANAAAFTRGWFRTGDQGQMDEEGYLSLTGRLKEIINRGGEKISPLEVDEVLLDHPAVVQAVTFAVPDSGLGEVVGAAVVLREGVSATGTAIRDFAASRLADFKVPQTVLVLDEIPKGPTGKLQRIGLAERLGFPLSARPEPPAERDLTGPRTPLESTVTRLWVQVLKQDQVGVHEHFLDLGGDSILAGLLIARIREELKIELSLRSLFDAPTVAEQAAALESLIATETGDARP